MKPTLKQFLEQRQTEFVEFARLAGTSELEIARLKKFHHQTSILLLEKIGEMMDERFYEFNDKEKDFDCNQRVLKLRNTLQSSLKEEIKNIKNDK